MRENIRVLVSNHWHKPQIKVTLFHDPDKAPAGGIALSLTLNDFLAAVEAESGHAIDPVVLRASVDSALEKIKQSSAPVGA